MTWLDDARAITLPQVAAELGVQLTRRGIPTCPSCGREESTRIIHGGARWMCFGCQMSGDALDLVAVRLTGAAYSRSAIDAVRGWYASRGWCEAWGDAPIQRVEPRPAPVAPPAAPEGYPEDIGELLDQCVPCDQDDEVAAWMTVRRGLGAQAPRRLALTGVLAIPRRAVLPRWARFAGRSWVEQGYRLAVPMSDAAGVVRSVRARCVGAPPFIDAPKAVPPSGFSQRGVVMAGRSGLRMLREGLADEVVVVEGEPQWLAACLRWPSAAVLGIVSGSWTPAVAERVPRGARVLVVTDHDEAGDRYAARVVETLNGRAIRRHEGVL